MPTSLSGLAGFVPLLVIYVLWRLYRVRRKFMTGGEVSALHEAGCLMLALFLFEAGVIAFTPVDFSMLGSGIHPIKVNSLPFSTIMPILMQEGLSLSAKLVTITSPYLMFVGVGLLFPLVVPRLATFRRTVLLTVLIAIIAEFIQLLETVLGVSVKTFAFDDVLFAAVAAAIGYAVFTVVRSIVRRYNPDFRRFDFYEPEEGEDWDEDEDDGWGELDDIDDDEYLEDEEGESAAI